MRQSVKHLDYVFSHIELIESQVAQHALDQGRLFIRLHHDRVLGQGCSLAVSISLQGQYAAGQDRTTQLYLRCGSSSTDGIITDMRDDAQFNNVLEGTVVGKTGQGC